MYGCLSISSGLQRDSEGRKRPSQIFTARGKMKLLPPDQARPTTCPLEDATKPVPGQHPHQIPSCCRASAREGLVCQCLELQA